MRSHEELAEELRAPIPSDDRARIGTGLSARLDELWVELLGEATKRPGEAPIDFVRIACSPDLMAVSQAHSLIRRTRGRVLSRFHTQSAPFYLVRIPCTPKQRKHFPKKGLSRVEVQRQTISGDSLFYCGVGISQLEPMLYDVLEQRFRMLLTQRHARVACDGLSAVGASNGDETNMVLFDINLGARDAHCYPIPHDRRSATIDEEELGYCSSDLLQGFPWLA